MNRTSLALYNQLRNENSAESVYLLAEITRLTDQIGEKRGEIVRLNGEVTRIKNHINSKKLHFLTRYGVFKKPTDALERYERLRALCKIELRILRESLECLYAEIGAYLATHAINIPINYYAGSFLVTAVMQAVAEYFPSSPQV